MNLLSCMRYLVALHEHKHFGRAAAACHITQPALSNALRALEAEFKVAIVKRDRHYEGLTSEGERVLGTAQRMLHEHALLQQELASAIDAPSGPVRIACVPTAIPIGARFAALLQARHTGIRSSVISLSSSELERRLENLSIDLGLGYTDRMHTGGQRLVAFAQFDEQYFLLRRLAVKQSDGLSIGAPISWRDAAKLPLCLLTTDMHNRTVVDAAFLAAGVSLQPVMETNSILTLALSVAAGDIYSIMPAALVDTVRSYRELQAQPLIEPLVHSAIGFMWHAAAQPSRALQAACDFAQDATWLEHVAVHSKF